MSIVRLPIYDAVLSELADSHLPYSISDIRDLAWCISYVYGNNGLRADCNLLNPHVLSNSCVSVTQHKKAFAWVSRWHHRLS